MGVLEMAEGGEAGLFATFGGQGYPYIAEARALYKEEAAGAFMKPIVAALEAAAASDEAKAAAAHAQGFALTEWLEGAAPSAGYLASASVSYPLVGLTQLARYVSTLAKVGKTHEEMVFKGATGHSQGVVSAVVLASSATTAELNANAVKMIIYLFWQGTRCQTILNYTQGKGASPMLAVLGLSGEALGALVDGTNKRLKLGAASSMSISLVNTWEAFVVSGPPQALSALLAAIEKESASPDEPQGRIPFSQRKPVVTTSFLRVTAPFHSGTMAAGASAQILADIARMGLSISGSSLRFPVYSTTDGGDLAAVQGDIMPALVAMQSEQKMDFPAALSSATASKGVTHVLDFGPGGNDAVGGSANFAAQILDGCGVTVVTCVSDSPGRDDLPVLVGAEELSAAKEDLTVATDWADFAPKLVKRACDGKLIVDTKFSQATGKPPVLMSGMTPTTSMLGIDLVSACSNGGYHCEFAGGGLPLPNYTYQKFEELRQAQDPGTGITLNTLYANPYLWGFQYPIVCELRKKGTPIESLTIGAGVPTAEKAVEICDGLLDAGIRYMAFKPGSMDAVQEVIDIAKANPKMTVMLQWTGGRGGGHHSFEDHHAPMLAKYGDIRREKNIVLVCGSGFGDAKGSMPYLTGEWSEAYGRPRMPMDCILMGSRPMVAKEAPTAQAVKDLICKTAGVQDKDWETSYEGNAGGVLTVQSELGEPIHKIFNRGMECWRDFDTKYFKIDRKLREAAILKDKKEIIARINSDFQKVYFPRKTNGTVCELEDMTYAEVLRRFVELSYVNRPDGVVVHRSLKKHRWIDVTYESRCFTMMCRFEQRFHRSGPLVASDVAKLDTEPLAFVNEFLSKYESMEGTLLSNEDVDFCIENWRNLRNGKPVNFIPQVDAHLDYWFKKDSLWLSEELDAVPDCDADRVCILQGPVSVAYSVKANEPVCDIMGAVHDGHVDLLLKSTINESEVPTVEFIGGYAGPLASSAPEVVPLVKDASGSLTATMPEELPDADAWTAQLGAIAPCWLSAAMNAPHIASGKEWIPNPIPRLFKPKSGTTVVVACDPDGVPTSVGIFDHNSTETPVVQLKRDIHVGGGSTTNVVLTVNEFRPATAEMKAEVVPAIFMYAYHPEMSYSPLHEVTDGAEERITDFYAKMWLDGPSGDFGVDTVHTGSSVITRSDIDDMNAAIGLPKSDTASLDFCTVAAWQPLIKSLFAREIQGNLFKLVHLSHSYELLGTGQVRAKLAEGERIDSSVQVSSVLIVPGGKEITAVGTLSRSSGGSAPVEFVSITSKFFIRGEFTDYTGTFRRSTDETSIIVKDDAAAKVLMSKSWFTAVNGDVNAGDTLVFKLSTYEEYTGPQTLAKVQVDGDVSLGGNCIGTVSFSGESITANPVATFLESRKGLASETCVFEEAYNMLETVDEATSPTDPFIYAVASRDLNPIHRNYYIAEVADLPNGSVINHGMWACAYGRSVVERGAAGGDPTRIASYEVSFLGMVFPGTELFVQLIHTGMVGGRKVITVEMKNGNDEVVVRGRAEVEQPKTAYVFTGQGSADPGMGMDRYEANPSVKAVWDTADEYLMGHYGFSIIDIVRRNPKELTIHFGGQVGQKIRQNYMDLQVEQSDGSMAPLLPGITLSSRSYTYKSESGLLFSTQFTQPAIMLVEKSAFVELMEAGYVPDDSVFAGHSLGEYAGLSSVATVLNIQNLVQTVFLRGLIMQNAVTRDARGHSDFMMMAINPVRVGRWFSTERMLSLVNLIDEMSGRLLQVVNFNVENFQYVVAGELRNLWTIGAICDQLATKGKELLQTMQIEQIVEKTLAVSQERFNTATANDGYIELKRGKATIPLPGIDVPFHSRELLGGVPAFRKLLTSKFDRDAFAKELDTRLINRYVPNVMAQPFSLEKDFIEAAAAHTGSAALKDICANWAERTANRIQLGLTLLIELLAHQFAMPVRWIETQALFFRDLGVNRLVEIGPAKTLRNMAARTLASGKFGDAAARELLFWDRDDENVFYSLPNAGPDCSEVIEEKAAAKAAAEEAAAAKAAAEEAAAAAAAAPPAPEPAATPAPAPPPAPVQEPESPPPPPPAAPPPAAPASSGGAPVTEEPPSALHALRVMLAVKFKKGIDEVTESTTIKAMAGGKSAIQNEVVGELQSEFGSGPEGGAEMPLSELASKFPGYNALGKVCSGHVNKMLQGKMPGGFSASQAKSYLADDYKLGPGRTDSVLLHAVTMQPSSRLGSVAEAKTFLDSACSAYGGAVGVSISKGGAAGGGGGGGMMMPQMMMMAGGGGGGAPAEPVPDVPVEAVVSLRVMLAVKFKKTLAEVPATATIKGLAGGKSAIQNEVVGELQAEFGSGPEGGAEMPLSELASKFPGYNALGKVMNGHVNKMLQGKMPGGFSASQAKSYLGEERLVGPGRTDSILCIAVSMQPPARLASVAEAKAFLDSAADAYGSAVGVTIPKASEGGGGGGGGMMMPMMMGGGGVGSEEMKTHQNALRKMLLDQIDASQEYLGIEGLAHERQLEAEKNLREGVEGQLDTLKAELGEIFVNGIKPLMSTAKVREYNSFWNWGVQEALHMIHSDDAVKKCSDQNFVNVLCNKATPQLVAVIKMAAARDIRPEVVAALSKLITTLEHWVNRAPVHKGLLHADGSNIMAPTLNIKDDGAIDYHEEPRASCPSAIAYVDELARGMDYQNMGSENPDSPHTAEDVHLIEVSKKLPYVVLKTPSYGIDPTIRVFDKALTCEYMRGLRDISTNGVTFEGQVALLTGAGRGSIAIELGKALLQGGATVIVTTWERNDDFMQMLFKALRGVYEEYGSKGARLIMVPVNCSSRGDVEGCVNYIYSELNLDIDYVVPFAAIPEGGRDIGRIDQISEMAHRMMLTNVLRLLGAIKNTKSERKIETRPAMVIMPCSPNHGVFGMDGLYSESKMGCESLVNKWQSEGWSNYLSICCCKIGWTRSALMWQNNIVAQGIEEMGCRTFSTLEQAYNLVGLMHPSMVQKAAQAPLWLDTTGGWQTIKDLKGASAQLRAAVYAEAAVKKALHNEPSVSAPATSKPSPAAALVRPPKASALANPTAFYQAFPKLPSEDKRTSLQKDLQGMVDLDQTVVVTGFGEVGPYGNARTRWEMESTGEFSLEGCIELAWICGLIRPHSGTGVKGFDPRQFYVGWVDASTGEPVPDDDVKKRYEKTILEHTGIRIVEPDLFEGYDPHHKTLYHQVAIDKKMAPLEVSSRQEALDYRVELGEENVDIYQGEGGEWFVQLRPGSVIWVPRALKFNRFVAGQLPTGWDAERYGVPKDIAQNVDPVTLFTLVSTVEAFIAAGITDPYEFYQYVHVSEVGNCSGGGMGGMRSLKRLFHERKLEKEIPSDTLAESFINTMPAWINMLLLSSSGPIKTPVGACATAAESVEVGVETILSQKARVVIVGGYDDFGEEGSFEFAAMGATNNSAQDAAAGRVPKEASRPMTSSRAGFVEAQGAGMQILMDAKLAIQMGVPIYGIVGLTNTATDREGRSVPAPGQGILTTARETKRVFESPLLKLSYRRAQLQEELDSVESWAAAQRKAVALEVEELSKQADGNAETYAAERFMMVERLEEKKRRGAYATWGNTFYKGLSNIAPLRGALAVWGLGVDDIAVASFHGTSTNANDRNESQVVHRQFEHLGRTRGNPVYCIAQKWLTGHPKGPAAAWMFNGVTQAVLSGVVPGNRNIDNTAPELQKYHHIIYPNRSLDIASKLGGMKAGLLKSFGFGQAGAEILVIHPDYLLATLDDDAYARYARLRNAREAKAYRYQQGVISGKHTLIQVKEAPPYTEEQQPQVYLDPTARASYDPVVGSWTFGGAHPARTSAAKTSSPQSSPKPIATRDRVDSSTRLAATMERGAAGLLVKGDKGVGVDIEPIATFADLASKQDFINRNFTLKEIAYANSASDPSSSYAGRWAAKEAVVKAISSTAPNTPVTQGADAPLIDIEVLSSDSGAPVVEMHGYAAEVMRVLGIEEVKVSISHAAEVAVAQAIAR